MLDKLQKQVCRTVGPSVAASPEPLAHRHNIDSLSLFYRYYFGRCSFELIELVPLPCSRGRSTRYFNKFHFSVTIPTGYKDVCINISTNYFQLQLGLWNYFPEECFTLTFDLNGLKTRVTWYFLYLDSWLTAFLYTICLFPFFSKSMPCRPWYDVQVIACAHIITRANQEKRLWRAMKSLP